MITSLWYLQTLLIVDIQSQCDILHNMPYNLFISIKCLIPNYLGDFVWGYYMPVLSVLVTRCTLYNTMLWRFSITVTSAWISQSLLPYEIVRNYLAEILKVNNLFHKWINREYEFRMLTLFWLFPNHYWPQNIMGLNTDMVNPKIIKSVLGWKGKYWMLWDEIMCPNWATRLFVFYCIARLAL